MYTGLKTGLAILISGVVLVGCASAPKYQGMDADQLFDLGAAEFQEENWDEAVEAFQRAINEDPTSDRLVEARLYLARAYYNRGDYITSIAEFQRIMDRHPGHPLAPDASLGICQAYVAQSPHVQRFQRPTEQAWTACQNTVADFQGHPVAAEATTLRDQMFEKLAQKEYEVGAFYLRRKVYQPAIQYFNTLLDAFPGSQWADDALFGLFQAYVAIDWDREAEEVRERICRNFPESEAAREIGCPGEAS